MIALGGPKLKHIVEVLDVESGEVSMIALGGPKLKLVHSAPPAACLRVSMIALGGPKLKPSPPAGTRNAPSSFNDSTGWA